MAAICYHWCEWKQKPSVLVCPLMSLTTKPQHLYGQLTLHKQLSVSKADLGSPRSKAEVYLLIALQGVDMHIMASSTHLLASFPNTLSLCWVFLSFKCLQSVLCTQNSLVLTDLSDPQCVYKAVL